MTRKRGQEEIGKSTSTKVIQGSTYLNMLCLTRYGVHGFLYCGWCPKSNHSIDISSGRTKPVKNSSSMKLILVAT